MRRTMLLMTMTILACAALPPAAAQEVPPMNVFGVAHLSGNPAANVTVTAYVNGKVADTTTSNEAAQYSVVIEGAAGDRITFQVHGKTAEQTATFVSGQSLAVNLNAHEGRAGVGGFEFPKLPGKDIPLPALVGLVALAVAVALTRRGERA